MGTVPMGATHDAIAIDLGASSGRCIGARFDGERLSLDELHRFENGPVRLGSSLHWDAPHLLSEILRGLSAAAKRGLRTASLAIDTWGVDYGLLSRSGELLGLPYHYRDTRTQGAMAQVLAKLPRDEIYARTGIQFMAFNTLYQLAADAAAGDGRLDIAHRLLFMPDLLGYWLTGESRSEHSIASTSQILDGKSRAWLSEILTPAGIPSHILPPVEPPARRLGELHKHVADETGIGQIEVIAAAGHDTACAVAAVPADASTPWAYISSGTWSLVGVEIPSPILSRSAMVGGFTNERGVSDTVRFHRNVAGLWILQECQRNWIAAGLQSSIDILLHEAASSPLFFAVFDPDDPRFGTYCDMPRAICEYLQETGQRIPPDRGTLIRLTLESLALSYAECISATARLTGITPERIHIVGGGSQNTLLCRFTADATGTEVLAGPVEATAAGNAMIQALAVGRVRSLEEIRKVIGASFSIQQFAPNTAASDLWSESFTKFRALRLRRQSS